MSDPPKEIIEKKEKTKDGKRKKSENIASATPVIFKGIQLGYVWRGDCKYMTNSANNSCVHLWAAIHCTNKPCVPPNLSFLKIFRQVEPVLFL